MMRIKGRQKADFSPWFCTAACHNSLTFSPELKETGNSISRAVMHHMGIDPMPKRHSARHHRGIVLIVHGPPRAGM